MTNFTLKCQHCGGLIDYEKYKADLRRTPFAGIHCPLCSKEQSVRYRIYRGTGRSEVVRYQKSFRHPKTGELQATTEVHGSCSRCGVFHVVAEDGGASCPICHDRTRLDEGPRRVVPVRKQTSEMRQYRRINRLESVLNELELRRSGVYSKVIRDNTQLPALEAMLKGMDSAFEKIGNQQKIILSNISTIEAKLNMGGVNFSEKVDIVFNEGERYE